MITELTKAAQQALEALRRAVPKDSEQAHEQLLAGDISFRTMPDGTPAGYVYRCPLLQ